MKIPTHVEMSVRIGHDAISLQGWVIASSIYDQLSATMGGNDFMIFTGEPDLIVFDAEKVFGRETSAIPILPGYPDCDGTNEQ